MVSKNQILLCPTPFPTRWVHPRLPPARLETLLKVAEPTGGGEAVAAVYEALKERIANSQGAAMETTPTEEPATPF